MALLSVDEGVFLPAARVTTAFALLYVATLIYQGLAKLPLAHSALKAKDKRFNRYTDERMLAIDRSVGNLLEWSVPFLAIFWLSMLLTDGATLRAGWVYVGFRALYPLLAVFGRGVGTIGPKPIILAATVPTYAALIAMTVPTVKALL